jgi:sulfur transfer protein SufE
MKVQGCRFYTDLKTKPLHQMDNHFNGDSKAATLGGTMLVIILQTNTHEIANTALMAAVGATVSFMMSVLLKYLTGKFRRK